MEPVIVANVVLEGGVLPPLPLLLELLPPPPPHPAMDRARAIIRLSIMDSCIRGEFKNTLFLMKSSYLPDCVRFGHGIAPDGTLPGNHLRRVSNSGTPRVTSCAHLTGPALPPCMQADGQSVRCYHPVSAQIATIIEFENTFLSRHHSVIAQCGATLPGTGWGNRNATIGGIHGYYTHSPHNTQAPQRCFLRGELCVVTVKRRPFPK